MADARIDIPPEFDPEAPPEPQTGVMRQLKRIRFIHATVARLESERKALQAEVIPKLRHPVALLDPKTGEPIVATAIQSHTKVVDPDLLKQGLIDHFEAEGLEREDAVTKALEIWQSVLKPPAVDTKDDGLFDQAQARGDIPVSVIAMCAWLKPSSAYIGFPKSRK